MPAQVASSSAWSPEKRLCGAVLESVLAGIRDHHADHRNHRWIVEDLRWIASDDDGPPFSFVRLCQLLGLEPDWVREAVRRWLTADERAAWQPLRVVARTSRPPRVRSTPATGAVPAAPTTATVRPEPHLSCG